MRYHKRANSTSRLRTWLVLSAVIVGLALTLSAQRIGLPVKAATANDQANAAAAAISAGKLPPGSVCSV